MKKKMLIFSPNTGLVSLVQDGQTLETGAIVLFDSTEILKGLESKPVTDVVIETVIEVLRRIPNKKITKEITAEVTMSYGFSFDSNELNQTIIETGELTNLTKLRTGLLVKIKEIDISTKVFNCLKANELVYVFQILRHKPEEFLSYRNFGKKSLGELVSWVTKDLGISVEKWEQISEFFELKNFDPEKELCTKIPMLTESDSWKDFWNMVSSFENVASLRAKDFADFNGHNFGKKLDDPFRAHSGNNLYKEKITDPVDQEKLIVLISEIKSIIMDFYDIEIQDFVNSLPID